MTHADRKTPRAGEAPTQYGCSECASAGLVAHDRPAGETTTCPIYLRDRGTAEPQETAVPVVGIVGGLGLPTSLSVAPTPPSPNTERARAWLAQEGVHRAAITPPADNVVQRLTALLDAVAAEAEARGRAEEREKWSKK